MIRDATSFKGEFTISLEKRIFAPGEQLFGSLMIVPHVPLPPFTIRAGLFGKESADWSTGLRTRIVSKVGMGGAKAIPKLRA